MEIGNTLTVMTNLIILNATSLPSAVQLFFCPMPSLLPETLLLKVEWKKNL